MIYSDDKQDSCLDNHQGWHVVFTKTNKYHWLLSRWPGHQHCFAMAKSQGGAYWIIINPSWHNITVSMVLTEQFPTIKSYWGDDIEVLSYNAKIDEVNTVFFGVFNCVSVVKRLLGIGKRSIITPNQLCEYLKHGI